MKTQIPESWTRIAAWLEENAPADLRLLQPPATQVELDSAGEQMGVKLSEDFCQMYRTFNGTDPEGESAGIFPPDDEWEMVAFGPLALTEVVSYWQSQKHLLDSGAFAGCEPRESSEGIANVWWNVGWIPFATNGGGDLYCVDMAPTNAGNRGQVITHSHETGSHKILAPSLSNYLSDLADALETGRFEYTEYGMAVKAEEESKS